MTIRGLCQVIMIEVIAAVVCVNVCVFPFLEYHQSLQLLTSMKHTRGGRKEDQCARNRVEEE